MFYLYKRWNNSKCHGHEWNPSPFVRSTVCYQEHQVDLFCCQAQEQVFPQAGVWIINSEVLVWMPQFCYDQKHPPYNCQNNMRIRNTCWECEIIIKITYMMAFTPRQYFSHIERNLGCPPISQILMETLPFVTFLMLKPTVGIMSSEKLPV